MQPFQSAPPPPPCGARPAASRIDRLDAMEAVILVKIPGYCPRA